jgi:hypothetical protein
MKTLGFVLLVAGIVMILVRGFFVTTEKKVVDVGSLEITKKENKWIGWPVYAGGAVAVLGLILVLTDKKR